MSDESNPHDPDNHFEAWSCDGDADLNDLRYARDHLCASKFVIGAKLPTDFSAEVCTCTNGCCTNVIVHDAENDEDYIAVSQPTVVATMQAAMTGTDTSSVHPEWLRIEARKLLATLN